MKILKDAELIYVALLAAAAWITFAEHPTARNLRAAILDSMDL